MAVRPKVWLLLFSCAASGASLHYRADESVTDLRTGTLTLRHRVEAWGEDFRLTAAWGTYRLDPEEILLGGGVRGVWRGDSAQCVTARVSVADSLVDLTGNVRLSTPGGSWLATPRLVYSSSSGTALLWGPLAVADSAGTSRAHAHTGWYRRGTQELHLADRCTLFVTTPGEEPLRVASDSTILNLASGSVKAWQAVSILGQEVSGASDRMDIDEDAVIMSGGARLEGKGVRCRAHRIVLHRQGSSFRQAVLEGDAWAARADPDGPDSLSDQAWGRRIVVWLAGEWPSRIIVTGQARAHHRVADGTGEEVGTNEAEGDSIVLELEGSLVRGVRVAGGARGTFHPTPPRRRDLPGERLEYAATSLTYGQDAGVLVLEGNASLVSGSARLTADVVRYSPRAHELVAAGNAVLRDQAQEIKGDAMTFDPKRRQGVVREGATKFEEAFSLGRRVARVDERRLNVVGGRFTTCDQPHPHFYVTTPRMRVAIDDKVVARSVVLWVHDVPVLYVPYWVFPIRRERHSGFLMPSFSLRNVLGLQGSRAGVNGFGYYLVMGDYADAEVTVDWTEGLGWTVRGIATYALRYRIPSGSLGTSFAKRNGRTLWEVRQTHVQNLPRGWRLTANVNATRSKTFIDQETWNAQDRLDRQAGLRSDVSVAKTIEGWGVRASLSRDQRWSTTTVGDVSSSLETVSSSLPELTLSRPSKRLFPSGPRAPWYKEIYASLTSSFRNRIVTSDAPGSRDRVSTGTVHAVQLTWQLPRLLRRFSLSPRATYHETWVHRGVVPVEGERLVNDRYGVLHDVGVSVSTRLYGLARLGVFGVEAIRHVVSPQVAFGYTPDWFLRGWDFSVGRFSAGDAAPYVASELGTSYTKARRLSMSLGNVVQVKVRRGDRTVKNDNLLNVNFVTGYDFERRDAGVDPWSPLGSTLTLSPGRGFSWTLATTHDPNRAWELQGASSTITARIEGSWTRPPYVGKDGEATSPFRAGWGLSATHSYARRRGFSDPHTLRLDVRASPTRGWSVQGWVNYDLRARRAMNKTLAITRDLHCWAADFSWYEAANQWHYLFKVYVKAYPQSLFVKHEERG